LCVQLNDEVINSINSNQVEPPCSESLRRRELHFPDVTHSRSDMEDIYRWAAHLVRSSKLENCENNSLVL